MKLFWMATMLLATLSCFAQTNDNDTFAQRDRLVGDPAMIIGSTAGAHAESGEPNHAGTPALSSVWWSWEAPLNGAVRLVVSNYTVPNQLRAAVYTGNRLSALMPVVAGGTASNCVASFFAIAGQTYQIAVDTRNGYPAFFHLWLALESIRLAEPLDDAILCVNEPVRLGFTNYNPAVEWTNVEFFAAGQSVGAAAVPPFEVSWVPSVLGSTVLFARATDKLGFFRETPNQSVRVIPPLTNDNFEAASALVTLKNGKSVGVCNTTFATHQAGEPVHRNSADRGSVWFTWIAPWTGPGGVVLTSSDTNAFCRVYTGTALDNLTPISLADGVLLRAIKDQQYFMAVDGLNAADIYLTIHPPPANDNFANAGPVPNDDSGLLAGECFAATLELGEPTVVSGADASLWWKWTAPAEGNLYLDTTSSFGMVVETSVYEGGSLGSLIAVFGPLVTSAWDPSCGWLSNQMAKVVVSAGTSYYLRFNGADFVTFPKRGPTSLIQAQFYFVPTLVLPSNDAFAKAIPLTGYSNVVQGSTAGSTLEPDEPRSESAPPQGSLWWRYTAPQQGLLRISCGSYFGIYRGSALGNLEVAASESGGMVEINVDRGETIRIAVYRNAWIAPDFTLTTLFRLPLLNDAFGDRIWLTGTNCIFAADSTAATLETGENKPFPTSAGHTVWYSWTAPFVGRFVFSSQSTSSGYCRAAIYTGNSLPELRLVAQVQNGSILQTEAGTTYHLQVDNEFPGIIEAGFSLAPLLPPTNDFFANAMSVFASSPVSVSGASLESGEPTYAAGLDRSLWWFLPPGNSGNITITSSGSLVTNVVLYLYRGDRLEDLVAVGVGTNRLKCPVVGGVSYYIAATVFAQAIGDVVVSVSGPDRTPAVIAENIMCDSSLETAITNVGCWKAEGGGWYVHESTYAAADGRCYLELLPVTTGWQDVPTVPGRRYQLRFAHGGDLAQLRVLANNQLVGALETPPPGVWSWTNFTFTALSSVTEIKFQSLGQTVYLDAISLVWAEEPPSFTQQPVSRTAYAGFDVYFGAAVRGMFPMRLQWYFQNIPLPGKTLPIMLLSSAQPSQSGSYYLVATNAFGAVTSAVVNLKVEAFEQPTIVLQPYSDTIDEGTYAALSVLAQGLQPMSYQWYLNSQPLAGATNRHVIFDPFTGVNAGEYKVAISNLVGIVWSLPARLAAAPPTEGGAIIHMINHSYSETEAPIFDVDGSRLSGSNFVAQLYGGPSIDRLRPTGTPSPFRSDYSAGYFYPNLVTLANVPADGFAYVQVRVWDRERAASYEEARAVGAKFGRSEILYLQAGGTYQMPPPLTGLKSFTLSAGLPEFVAGRLALVGQSNGVVTWALVGHEGYHYLIERADTGFVWEPFLVVMNETGTATFQAPVSQNPNFFRARILE